MAQVQIDQSLFSNAANKTVLITGAARGIGTATAALFNENGANVIIADLAQFRDVAEEVIKNDLAFPGKAIFVPANIVDWVQLRAAFKKAIDVFGGIDIVVANAGIMERETVLNLEDVDENGELRENAEASRVIDVNLKGTFNSKLLTFIHYLQLVLYFVYATCAFPDESSA